MATMKNIVGSQIRGKNHSIVPEEHRFIKPYRTPKSMLHDICRIPTTRMGPSFHTHIGNDTQDLVHIHGVTTNKSGLGGGSQKIQAHLRIC